MTSVSSSSPRAFRSVEQRGDRPVALLGVVAVAVDVGVVVPGLVVAVVDLHDPHAPLDQPAGDQAGVGELARRRRAAASPATRGPGRTPRAPRTACGRPSPARRSRASSASSWPRAARCSRLSAWSRSTCSRCAARGRWRLVTSRMIRSGSIDVVADVRALVDARQEAAAPQLRADDRLARAEHHEAGQVLVLRAQAEGQPRAEARPDRLHVARVHHQQRRLVIRVVGVQRAEHADVVDAAGDVREEVGDLDAALAARPRRERRGHELAASCGGPVIDRGRRGLAGVLLQGRLGVEGVDVRRPAVHEQEDHPLRPRGEVRRPGGQRIGRDRRLRRRPGPRTPAGPDQEPGVGQHAPQAQRAEPAADPAEQRPAGHRRPAWSRPMPVSSLARMAGDRSSSVVVGMVVARLSFSVSTMDLAT